MNKQNGITLIALTVTIVVMMIIAGITINIGQNLIQEAKIQDLRTNMLLIQAEAKKDLEEVNFQKITTIDAAKDHLIGEPVQEITDETAKNAIQEVVVNKLKKELDDTYFYINPDVLNSLGIKDLNTEDYGYFVVQYNLSDTKVEVINTNGYQGYYTLTAINNINNEDI